jgi:hypothetical protein
LVKAGKIPVKIALIEGVGEGETGVFWKVQTGVLEQCQIQQLLKDSGGWLLNLALNPCVG